MVGLNFRVTAEPREVGAARLDGDGRLVFPRLHDVPGVYRFLLGTFGEVAIAYVGETDQLRRRLQHYRTPGPTQLTNIRINQHMCAVLTAGGLVDIAVIERADGPSGPLDLSDKAIRVLIESAWLVSLKAQGIPVLNA